MASDKILRQNKIPGCERLTRPEEIKALSKYLRHVKEVLEENTDLDEETLEIPGKTTGQFHNIDELPQGYDRLDPSYYVDSLEVGKIKLDGVLENQELEDYKDNIEDPRENKLEDYKDNIEDLRENKLEDYKDNIEGVNNIDSLYDSVIGIEDLRENELEDYKDNIEDPRENELEDYKDNIEDPRENKLEDYKDNITDSRENKLEDYKDNIEDPRENELEDYKDNIEDPRENELEDYKDNITDSRENKLEDYKDNITDSRENKLEDYKDNITDPRENELEDYKDNITDPRENKLEDYKDNITDPRENELEDYKDNITDPRENELEDYKDNITDSKNINIELLPNHKKTITNINEVESLYDSAIGIEDLRENELSNYRDNIEDPRENSLEDYRDNIEDPRENKLEDYKDNIEDPRENKLEDYKDNIEDPRENKLEDYKDNIEDPRENSLEDYKDNIEDPRENSLEDYINQLDEGEFKNPIKPTTNLPLDEGEFKNPIKPTTNLELPDNNNEIFHNEWNTDGSPGYYGSWDNVIPKIIDEREPRLENTVIKKDTTYNPKTGTLGTDGFARIDSDYDYIDNSVDYNNANPIIQLKAKNKFERHQKIIERPDNREDEARIDGTFPNNEWNTDGSPGYYGSWDNVIPKIIDEREPKLEDNVIKKDTTYNPKTGTLFTDGTARIDEDYDYIDNSVDYDNANPIIQLKAKNKFERHQKIIERPDNENQNPIYELIKNISDEEFYNFVLGLYRRDHDGYTDIDSDLDIDTEWKEKIASLISTYLNPGEDDKPISPKNAHRFEEELFRSINLVGVERDQGGEYRPRIDSMQGGLSRNTDGTARIDGDYDFIDIHTSNVMAEQNRASRHTEDEYKYVPFIQLPEDSTILDKVEYIRFAAETIVGDNNEESRKYLLTETLWALVLARRGVEKTAGINRDRLPGRQNGIGTVIDNAYNLYNAYQDGNIINAAIDLFARYLREKPNPINRPEVDWRGQLKGDTKNFELGNDRYNVNRKKGIAGKLENLWNNMVNVVTGFLNNDRPYSFKDNYLKGGGITTTLVDLCKGETPESVEGLLELFKNSPYITTPSQFGTIHEGSYGTQTLDSNAYWEVVIEPFCDHYLNGGYSYLPCFDEINVINYSVHGVHTAYNKWVPISNFELQKSKLTSKTVGLYDGEISFPLTAEFTNEIRFTIVDDQYKSWRNYFQKCMDVAVYNSESHNSLYYSDLFALDFNNDSILSSTITAVDKSIVSVALYKNITFRIRIYIMTPQYSTIRRFDLLCVLKDFVEEYSGDIDSGGVDLNVTFSIVGENPIGAENEEIGNTYINEQNRRLPMDIPKPKTSPIGPNQIDPNRVFVLPGG